MKITIENFGAIKHFVFDTEKDLTLIFGKNSVGKSYAISLVYLILKTIFNMSDSILETIKFMTETLKIATNSTTKTQKFIDNGLSYIYTYSIVTPLNDSIKNTFGELKSITNQFSESPLKITIENSHLCAILELDTNKEKIILESFESKDLIKNMISDILNQLEPQNINNIYYLPASRSGLYHSLSAFGDVFAELSRNRSITSKIGLTTISEPVLNYQLNLSRIEKNNENPDFSEYVNEIEQEILQGKVDFDTQSKKNLLYT